ncbi:MAG TPA: hypothetical protein VLH79_10985 [Chthonomonadales bacterium]|nr:hypothetical protein [Chthonomonadales bacterium]
MRMFIIVCEAGVDERVIEHLERLGAPGFTRFTGAIGHGRHGRREGTAVWPGLNSVLITCLPAELHELLLAAVDALRVERNGRLAIRVFSVPAEDHG